MDNKLITCISIPRSGTTYVFEDIFTTINELNVNLELFNPIKKDALLCINKKYFISDFEKKKSIEIIEHLLNYSEEKYIIHKIFSYSFNTYIENYDYESNDELRNLFKLSQYFLFIKRNFLDCYISEKKAKITKKYRFIDTSDIKIIFGIEEFNFFKNYWKEWFKYTKQKCIELNKNFVVFDYDELIKLENENDKNNYCFDKIKEIICDEITFKINNNKKLIKQDKSENYEDKIENYEEVKSYLENKENFINDII
jgi:hypothetical protein